jgi:hypothetical protein
MARREPVRKKAEYEIYSWRENRPVRISVITWRGRRLVRKT